MTTPVTPPVESQFAWYRNTFGEDVAEPIADTFDERLNAFAGLVGAYGDGRYQMVRAVAGYVVWISTIAVPDIGAFTVELRLWPSLDIEVDDTEFVLAAAVATAGESDGR